MTIPRQHSFLTASIAGQWSSALPLPSFRKGAVDDTASPTHDRGHAIKKPFARYATIVSSSNQSIGAILREIARQVGSPPISDLRNQRILELARELALILFHIS